MVNLKMLKLPTPSSISYNWNFGSLLGLNLITQILTGFIMTMYFNPSLQGAFDSVVYIMTDVNYGWMIRLIHANGATSFFFLIYFHIARGLFYKSFIFSPYTWMSGVTLYLLFMAVAFLGYVLPWGQMSFWGATVITNLISAIPFIGSTIVEWIWGGFSVGNPTLTRFFSLHYVLPFIGLSIIFIHLFFLHETGSSNPLGLGKNTDKIFFHPFFSIKDLIGFAVFFFILFSFSFKVPMLFMDSDNFMVANPMTTPAHIQPEWYFLFAYAILRSIPSKLGGVISLLMSIIILYFLPLFSAKKMSFFYKIFCTAHFFIFFCLTFIGMMPVEFPYFMSGLVFSIFYFFNLILLMIF